MTDRTRIVFYLFCSAVIGFYIGGLAAGAYTFKLTLSDVFNIIFTAAIVYFAMQQNQISKSQFKLSQDLLKPYVIVSSEDYRDIYVHNAGTRPVYNVKLHVSRSQEKEVKQLLDTKLIGSGKYEKVEIPEEWREEKMVLDYLLLYSIEPTGKMEKKTGFFKLVKP
ncbi:hypothetical protein KA005_63380 [bacterium]|nr:hypothetical protein [bacterium]